MCNDLEPGIMYKVIKPSSDGRIEAGNLVEAIEYEDSLAVMAMPPDTYGKILPKQEWQKLQTCDFEAEIWEDNNILSDIKSNIKKELDIDKFITYYTQSAMYVSSSDMHTAIKNLQIAQWLKELKSLRKAVQISGNDW